MLFQFCSANVSTILSFFSLLSISVPYICHYDNLNKLDENKLEPKTTNLGIEINEIKEEETVSTNDIEKKLEELGDYDPTLRAFKIIEFQVLRLQKTTAVVKLEIDKSDLEEKKDKIVETLGHYKEIGITHLYLLLVAQL